MSAPTTHDHPTVLLVDDEDAVRRVASRMLERLGFSVVTAENGEQAVANFEQHPQMFDLVVMDLTMPTMTGEDACIYIQQIRPEIPIIITSGLVDDRELHINRDTTVFLQKPFQYMQLKDTVDALCPFSS